MVLRPRKWAGSKQVADNVTMAGFSPERGVFIVETIESHQEGSGNVGRYLDELKARHHTVIVLAVINPRLAGMLERRGFIKARDEDWAWRSPLAPPLSFEKGQPHE